MAAAQTFLSLELFETLNREEKPYLEYWFGRAIPKESNTTQHGTIETIVASLISRRGWRSALEVRLKLSAQAQPIPDIIADSRRIKGPYPTEPFDLCVEILSPGEDIRKLFEKGAHYLDWKIRNVWIIDPELRKGYVMTLKSPSPIELNINETLTASSGDSTMSLPLSEVFAEIEQASLN